MDDKDFKKTVSQIMAKESWDHELNLMLDDCRIKVQTNSDNLLKKLQKYFQPFIQGHNGASHIHVKVFESQNLELCLDLVDKRPEPGKKKIKEQFCNFDSGRVVRKKLSGMVFYFDQEHNLAIGPCAKNDNQVINFINNRFIQWKLDQGCLLCHAAAVANNGHGLVIAGFSGMGKSTLALHLMNEDLTFISNDRLMVEKEDSGLKMYGVAKLPRVNPGTILNNHSLSSLLGQKETERFKKIKTEKIWDLECKYDVFLDECFGPDKFKLTSKVKGLILLNWEHSSEPVRFEQVNLAERQELLGAVMKSPGLFYLSDDKQSITPPEPDRYLELFSCCDVYELSGGVDFAEATRKCAQLIL